MPASYPPDETLVITVEASPNPVGVVSPDQTLVITVDEELNPVGLFSPADQTLVLTADEESLSFTTEPLVVIPRPGPGSIVLALDDTIGPPGTPGTPGGPPGPPGSPGVNAYSITDTSFVVPPIGSSTTVTIDNASWAVVGQTVYIENAGGTGQAGALLITAKSGNTLTLYNPTIGSSTGIPEAPTDGQFYARKNAAWFAVMPVPTGVMLEFGGTAAPTGFLLCDGSAVSRSTYAGLFAVIGTNFGSGDGSTTFNVPDSRSRVTVGAGQGTGLSNRAIGAIGGEETHALTAAENGPHGHGITDNGHVHNMDHYHTWPAQGSHSHGLSDSQHNHYMGWTPLGTGIALGASGYAYFGGGNWLSGNNNQAASGLAVQAAATPAGNTNYASQTNGAWVNTGNAGTGISIQSSGSGTGHNNMMPFLVVTRIIKI